jgi:hypothetical protein
MAAVVTARPIATSAIGSPTPTAAPTSSTTASTSAISAKLAADLLNDWDTKAILSSFQLKAIQQLSTSCVPHHLARPSLELKGGEGGATSSTSTTSTRAAKGAISHRMVIESTLRDSPDIANDSILDRQHSDYHDWLIHYDDTFTKLVTSIDDLLINLRELDAHYQSVANKTNEVREECQALLTEQKRLLDQAARLRAHLAHFDEAGTYSYSLSQLYSVMFH